MRDLGVSGLPSVLPWGSLFTSRCRRFASHEKLRKKKRINKPNSISIYHREAINSAKLNANNQTAGLRLNDWD